MITHEQLREKLDKLKRDDTMIDIRDDKVLVYRDGQFILDVDKLGDFWYIRREL